MLTLHHEPIVRTAAVERCAQALVKSITQLQATVQSELLAILHRNLGVASPNNIVFEESSLLVRTVINTPVDDGNRNLRSTLVQWLCGAPMESGGV
jgi:hypothetical protein